MVSKVTAAQTRKFRRRRICHLSSVHSALDTRIFFKECMALAHEFEVDLIAPYDKKEVRGGIRIIPLPIPRSRLSRLLYTDWLLVLKALRVNASVYHFHDPELIPAGLLLRLLGKKVVYDVHEFVLSDMEEKSWVPSRRIFKFIYRQFEKLACRYFELVLAEDSYEPHYRARTRNITIVRNFADLKIFSGADVAYNAASRQLLFVGSLGARRALPCIIEALSILKQRGVYIQLLCIGAVNDAVKQILKDSPHYPQVKTQIEFKGFLPVQQAYKYASGCFAGLALPEDLDNHRKSFPTKLFEYMAIGLPVIASHFPLYKAVVLNNNCGLCVNPAQAGDIANAIEKLYMQKEVAAQMAENGRQAAVSFAWEQEEKKLLELYNTMLG